VSKKHDTIMALLLGELIKQMLDPKDDEPPSENLERSFLNVVCAISAMAYELAKVDPVAIVGALDIAKSQILHSYYELMTQQKMERGS